MIRLLRSFLSRRALRKARSLRRDARRVYQQQLAIANHWEAVARMHRHHTGDRAQTRLAARPSDGDSFPEKPLSEDAETCSPINPMKTYPKTLDEARATRYGHWAGNPNGSPYQEGRCAFQIWTGGGGSLPRQCLQKNGHGPSDLYCKKHAPMVEELPAITIYSTSKYDWNIGEEEASRIEGESIWRTNGRRESRSNDFCSYWSTKEQAVRHLLFRCEKEIESAEFKIKEAKEAKSKLRAMLPES